MIATSHYTNIALAITDQDALLAALADMGYEGKVEIHDTPVTLIGYDGAPRRLNGCEVQAEVIVRRRHLWRAANDIGFARQPDGTYVAYVSEYDADVIAQQPHPNWQERLLQGHGVYVAQQQLREMGCLDVEVTRQADGTVVVAGARYA